MANLRGVAFDDPIQVTVLDGPAFVERFHAHDSSGRFIGVTKKFWAAFHFAPDEPGAEEAQRTAADDAVAGFYDTRTDELFVRAGRTSVGQRHTLAHEIAHAVQCRFAALPSRNIDADEALARRALLEGDAEVMAAAYLAMEGHRAVGVSIARIRDRLKGMTAAELAKFSHLPRSAAIAPALVRARMFFPYVEGTAFATALYQSGGLALLNAALAHPPVSTEQVLHPEKYVAGELPIPVSPPLVWDGAIVDHGTLGELQTGVYLAQCMNEAVARQTAQGWGGDAYTVVADDGGNPSTLWSTVWDSEDAAVRFESALRAREHCAGVDHAPRTVRRGARVAVVDGPDDARYKPEDLLDLVQAARAPAPPVGDVFLRSIPPPEPRFLHRGTVVADTFTSKDIGVSASVPDGAIWAAPAEGPELSLRTDSRLRGLFFVFEPVTAELEQDVMRRLAPPWRDSGHDAGHGDACTQREQEDVIKLTAGLADVDEMVTTDCRQVVAAFVPACDGEAAVVLFGFSQGSSGAASPGVDDWFDTLRLAAHSPACDYLRVLAAPAGGASVATAALRASSSLPPVDLAEAKRRLSAIAADVQSCKGNGPSGTGRVVVVFTPAGVAQSARVGGPPFEGTPAGDCVAERFKQARLPPFNGPLFSVAKSFSIE
jgi:hypothetical protein